MVNPQPSFTVRGQVRRSDNASIGSGFTVRAFDRISPTNEVPLGQPVPLQPNGIYQITYTWQSTGGRNGPALVVKLFNPQGQELASQTKTVATRLETLDLTWNLPPQPQTFTLFCTVKNQATGDSLPNFRVEAIFRVTNKTILTHSGTTNAQGTVVIPFDRALFNNLPQGQSIEVIFQVYQGNQQLQTSTTIPNLQRENQKVEILVTVPAPPRNYLVRGTIQQRTGAALVGAIVHADNVGSSSDRLGTTRTNDSGYYEIRYTLAAGASNPNLVIRIHNEQGQQIAASPPKDNAQPEETIDLIVASAEPPQEEIRVVKGTIRQADGSPLGDTTVRAFDKDIRHEQLLGEKVSDRVGYYEITYTRSQFRRAEKGSADLVSKVFASDSSLLATSPILFNAPAIAEINLTVPAEVITPLTLFEKIQQETVGLLDGLVPSQLEENEQHQDVSFLAGETGFSKNDIARFSLAHKLAQQAIQPEFWFALLGGSFFQFRETQSLDQHLATILNSLPSLDATAVNKALTRSFNLKEIPEGLRENVESWIAVFLQFAARQTVSNTAEPSFVKLALEDAGIRGTDKQEQFAQLFNQYKAITPELTERLQQNNSFTPAEIADVQTSFQLNDLARSNFSVVKAIKEEFGVRQPEQIRTLAKKSEQEWVDFVTTRSATGNLNLPVEVGAVAGQVILQDAEVYGKMLDRQFREAFPTTAFTGGLERALQNGGTHGLHRSQDINRFLNRHETFELLNTSVDQFLQERIDPDLRELAEDENFRIEVKAVQRVFKLNPTFEATDTLLADDLHSAQKIYRLGESEFVRRYGDRPGFTSDTARLAWNRAADTHAAVLTIVADLKALETEALPLALRNNNEALSNFPNWNNLFKAGDLCECEHCRSVLSPAAYFADLLMFLKDRKSKPAKNPGDQIPSVKDILFARRSDLGFLELNCDNALVTLPYIDVVCEVLEAAIDSNDENVLELEDFTAIPTDPVAAQTAVRAAFQAAFASPINADKQKIELGSNFSLSQLTPPPLDFWVVHTDDVTYLLIRKLASPNFSAAILRNTKASSAELRAYPQYVNPVVYNLLKTKRYPMSLPFDLFAEEVKAGFQKTNLQRWDLMRTFQGTTEPNKPTEGDIAAEYFGISVATRPDDSSSSPPPSEKTLILNAVPTEQQEIWGESDNSTSNNNWLTIYTTIEGIIENSVCNARYFLKKTGLEYTELLALLDLKFINPIGDIFIQHLDPSCDIDKKVIQGLDVTKLDRIHRFLRLWRKLKTWKMWELNLVICHPHIGNEVLDETFLINLFYFSEIKKKLGGKITVEQVCALFDDLNTETHFTKLHEKQEDALYQNLFLNKRLIQPLDPAFKLDPAAGDLPTGETIAAHHPVVLAAVGIREVDLILLKQLKAADNTLYIPDTDDLTLPNLSFLWRHTWLLKLLKFKAEDWKIVLKIFPHEVPDFADLAAKQSFLETNYHIKTTGLTLVQIDELLQKVFYRDVSDFACPKSAFEFLERVDQVKASGFTPDELNWLLLGDRSTKAATKETDTVRFLTTLRQELQRIKAEYEPTQYDFLTVTSPTDVNSLTTLLTALLQKLNRSEAEVSSFLAILRGSVLLEASVQGLPNGFAFPTAIVDAPNHIPIQDDAPNQQFRFTGLLTDAQRQILLDNASPALTALREISQFEAPVQDLPVGFVFPDAIIGESNNIPIQYDEPHQRFRFTGLMTDTQQTVLLNDASLVVVAAIPAYRTAIENLYQQSFQVVNNYRGAINNLSQQSLKVLTNYRSAIEELYQQSLAATADYLLMERRINLPGDFTLPATITGTPNAIPIRYEQTLYFTGAMTTAQRDTLLNDPSLADVTGIQAYRDAVEQLFKRPGKPAVISNLPDDFIFPADISNSLPIRYEQTLRFTGVMTAAQRDTLLHDPSLAAVTGIPAYQTAIAEFFDSPRMAMKFFEPVFITSLSKLPAEVDFKAQLPAELAAKITYDVEQELLRFTGIMSDAELAAILSLSSDAAYATAVNSLATQPQSITLPDERIWLTDDDLDITQPANSTYAKCLANAAKKALNYLSNTLTENAAVQQTSAQLGLTEAMSRYLLAQYAVVPNLPNPMKTLLTHLTGDFTIDSTTINGWYWANRVAAILKKWKLTLAELKKITALVEETITLLPGAQLLDFKTLPLDSTDEIASLDHFLRTSRLLRLRDSLPETEITLLEVLEKLNQENLSPGTYATNAFADDVERLNEAWLATDVAALTASLNLTYPADYLLAETWERLRRAFYFLDNLNASANTVKAFAAAAMTLDQAKILKELLRSKFGTETWLALSTEIQDVLRECKRDALTAYLLTQPKPADVPSGKWENTNDLYAYYLLDVEMSSCQLTSRLVQASGSVQLFVQRCFMGLEPAVVVKAGDDGDSAWRWWKWMRKYRVWEANRKVFLWPENWIEPELKKDRSSFFKDMENELLQNEINQDTVEKAFINYLEKLDGVAQLEIAGFYQEDDGDNTIIHVFGRTKGAEPHLYYYRRYDYRQWTPWEKVELDIQGDYLIPAVVNQRLFLFWPVFTEVPDEQGNREVSIPGANQTRFTPDRTKKRLRLQMAVSDYRQGKWTPKRVSTAVAESRVYEVEIVRKHYSFFPIDRSKVDGRFGIGYDGYSDAINGMEVLETRLTGAFEFSGCGGVLENVRSLGIFSPAIRPEWILVGNNPTFLKWVELDQRIRSNRLSSSRNDFTLTNHLASVFNQNQNVKVLEQTPGTFKMAPPWHLSYFDQLWLNGIRGLRGLSAIHPQLKLVDLLLPSDIPETIGTWLPFFYSDQQRTFFVLPAIVQANKDPNDIVINYYPAIKRLVQHAEEFVNSQIQTWSKQFNASTLPPVQRRQVEEFLHLQFNDAPPLRGENVLTERLPIAPINSLPTQILQSYTDDQIKHFFWRWAMRFYHYLLGRESLNLFQTRKFHFENFYHPFVCEFSQLVHHPLKGIPVLMSRESQLRENTNFSFDQLYQPEVAVVQKGTEAFYPKETVDFSPNGAYSPYNWELFFHAPLLIANSLTKNQRFEEAQGWYHYIFNPIGVESPVPTMPSDSPMRKYWITKPFFETTKQDYLDQRIDNILKMLAKERSDPGQPLTELERQVTDWRTNPFEPHRIANYRTVAYQKTVVMKYLDNLIAWGDNLFRQDSMESINEATQLYILAAEILGPRPKKIPPQAKPPVESFNELEPEFDRFSNALVQIENLVPVLPGNQQNGNNGNEVAPIPMLYFCIPQNDKMLGYWDTVADRLYKIRNCMNIEGVVRQLALFEPPIDPSALVKAVAGGVDISSALADLNAPLPLYRFNVLLQKANEVCNDVKALGSALLSALEKKDAEAMGLLRQSQEIRLLEAVKVVREKQIEEAKENLEGVKKSKELAQIRKQYYESREFMNAGEIVATVFNGLSIASHTAGTIMDLLAGVLYVIPNFNVGAAGAGGTPLATATTGGDSAGNAAQRGTSALYNIATIFDKSAGMANTIASYQRRLEEWNLQKDLAIKEIEQLDKSIAAADLRVKIAEKELENHVIQIENAKATDQFMRSKYTNEELYQWQIGQISGIYFQSYKLTYDLAKRAEHCFRFELGLQDSSYIQFGYWDSLKKGLLSGEKLQYDLRRLEAAYLEQNRREFELIKHISLMLLDPLALIKLRETGRCFINLPEEIFDLDYPGHYFRRVKSVSLTLPCVTGPYTTISCTLRLLKNSIRINTANGDNGYTRNTDEQGLPADDSRFIENNIPVKAIAASNAQNDSGIFELSFRDERYLPFEGAGAISQWSLELFNDLPANNPDPGNPDFGKPLRQFDYRTITDAILHIKYTAREDAGPFKNGAIAHLREYFSQDGETPTRRMFNLRHEFPSQWHRFLNPANPADGNIFELEMTTTLFPIRDQGKNLKVNTIWLLARCTDPGSYTATLTHSAGTNSITLTPNNKYGGLHFGQPDALEIEIDPATERPIQWQLQMTRPGSDLLQPDEVEDLLFILGYEWE